jgi:hypothetical protein
MGACEFAIDNIGKTVAEAFDQPVESARFNYGHAGYTGTMAEKDGFVLIDRPPRITADRLMATIIDATQWAFWLDTAEKYRHVYTKPEKRCEKAWDRLCKWFPHGEYYGPTRSAESLCKHYDDKWGPAIAVEQSPAEKKERWKNIPRGSKTFLFFGLASS